jgi:hypothetical protein
MKKKSKKQVESINNSNEKLLLSDVIGSSSRHPKCKGWKKYDWGMMDGPEYGCGYNTTIECNECMYCVGEKDPENYR